MVTFSTVTGFRIGAHEPLFLIIEPQGPQPDLALDIGGDDDLLAFGDRLIFGDRAKDAVGQDKADIVRSRSRLVAASFFAIKSSSFSGGIRRRMFE